MAHIFSIANQKGGVGKTTTSINLSTALAAAGHKVLLIDFDPQANASTGLGVSRHKRLFSSYHLLIDACGMTQVLQKTHVPGLSVIPSSIDLLGAEIELVHFHNREFKLKDVIIPYKDMFDFIFIDCPPSMGLLTLNAFNASTGVIVPLQCEYYALEGLSYLLSSIQKIKTRFNPSLDLFGVVLTMHDRRNTLNDMVMKDVRSHLKGRVFETMIPRNARVAEAPSHGKPVLIYDIKCAGSKAYMELAKEILQKLALKEEHHGSAA